MSVAVGAAPGGFALAFSLGAQPLMLDLIAAHQARRRCRIGQALHLGGFEGQIVELTPTGLVLETAGAGVSLPARLLHEQPVVLLREAGDDG